MPWLLFLSLALVFAAISQWRLIKYRKMNSSLIKEQLELKEVKATLENITQGIAESIMLISKDFRILWANRAFIEESGYNPEEIVGASCYSITHRRDAACEFPLHTCPLQESVQTGKAVTVLHTHFDKKGEKKFIEVSVYPVKDKEGRAFEFVHVSRDITERKRIDELKDQFISNISHELRTPLSTVKEGVEVVLDGTLGQVNKEQKSVLETTKNNIERLARIVDGLLDISTIETGKLELSRSAVNIADIVRQQIKSFGPLARAKGIVVKEAFFGQNFEIYGDYDRINQVFSNLINNAVKFTVQGEVEIIINEKEDEIECSVKDTGIGIAVKNIPKTFGKFQQFGRGTGAGEKGLGLGLVLVKEIIEMHGGSIWFESQLGKGSCFTFVLPKYSR